MYIASSMNEEMSVCSVLLLKEMGERNVYEDHMPPCARDYNGFVKKLKVVVDEYITEHSPFDFTLPLKNGYHQQPFQKDLIKQNFKVVQCVLIESQKNARKYLKKFGFMETGPFSAWGGKEEYNKDLYYYLMSAEKFSDFFYPDEETKKEAA